MIVAGSVRNGGNGCLKPLSILIRSAMPSSFVTTWPAIGTAPDTTASAKAFGTWCQWTSMIFVIPYFPFQSGARCSSNALAPSSRSSESQTSLSMYAEQLQCVAEAEVQALHDRLLRLADGERRVLQDVLRDLLRPSEELIGGHDLGDDADAVRLLGVDPIVLALQRHPEHIVQRDPTAEARSAPSRRSARRSRVGRRTERSPTR